MLKAIKVRLYPTLDQQHTLSNIFGSVRFVYNLALSYKIEHYNIQKQQGIENIKYLNYNDICKEFKDIRNDTNWLSDINAQIYQQSLMNLDIAFQNFFKRKNKGFPKYKKRNGKESVKFTKQCISKYTFTNNKLNLTKSLKQLKFKCSDRDKKYLINNDDTIISITVSKESNGCYFASFCVDTNQNVNISISDNRNDIIGIDLGIKTFIVTSDNEAFDNEKYLKKSSRKLKKLQRKLSRKKRRSKNYNRIKLKIARLHLHIRDQRKNNIHNISKKLINENQVVSIEDLNVSGLLKNHKLAKCISDLGLGEFKRQLLYKAEWYGSTIIQIDRYYPSSKKCSNCGEIKHDLTLNDRIYSYVKCGFEIDRDLNAALNIRNEGLRLLNL